MCFSAEASFGAAAVITTVGVISYKKAKNTPLRYLALIPIFFGIQQFSEGVVWLSTTYEQLSSLKIISTYVFVFFAWVIWPIYVPFVMWKIEERPLYKKIMLAGIFVGFVIISTLAFVMMKYGINAEIQDCSIKYKVGFVSKYEWLLSVLYLIITTLPHLLSSMKKVWVLGVLNLITFSVSKIYYQEHVLSVWCFLAAIASIVILWIITSAKNEERRRAPSQGIVS